MTRLSKTRRVLPVVAVMLSLMGMPSLSAHAVGQRPFTGMSGVRAGKSTAVVGLPATIQYLDPQKTVLVTDSDVLNAMFDPLLRHDNKEKVVASLATKWKHVSSTGWLFTLRQGVKFTDGEPFNADTVVWNIKRITAKGFQDYAFMSPVATAKKISTYQVEISTKKPYAMMPSLMTLFLIIPPKYAERVGESGLQSQPVGTGPYKFVSYVRGSELKMTWNPGWWGWKTYKPAIKNITWRIMPDASTRLAALKAGEVDLIKTIPPDQFSLIASDPNLRAIAKPSLRTVYLRFFPDAAGGAGKPFTDVRVRQAFNYAINIDSIIKYILNGQAKRTASLMTSAFPFYDKSLKPYPYNPTRAKQLLAAAGYSHGFSITFDVWSDGPSPNTAQVAQAIVSDLGKVGIKVNLQTYEVGTLLQMQLKRTISEFGLWSWGSALVDPDDKFWGVFNTASESTFLTNAKVSQLTDAGQQTFSSSKRKAIYVELQKMIHDQALIVPLFVMEETYGLSKQLSWQPRPDSHIDLWDASFK